MRMRAICFLAAAALLSGPAPDARAGGRNPYGYGLYTPEYSLPDGRTWYSHVPSS